MAILHSGASQRTVRPGGPTALPYSATDRGQRFRFADLRALFAQANEEKSGDRPRMADLLARHAQVRPLQIEHGRGKRLGRSFRVKLWPTLVFLRDGEVLHVAVLPPAEEIERGFAELVGGVGGT